MGLNSRTRRNGMRRGWQLLPVVASSLCILAALGIVSTDNIGNSRIGRNTAYSDTTYSNTETIPVPPASSYGGSGGGDGWAVAVSSTEIFNAFHHSAILQIACHLQTNASPCWSPVTITDASGDNFATSGQPGLWLDQATDRLYVFATRTSDDTGGVVCVDTAEAQTNPDPFCGFTALTSIGDSPQTDGISAISDPVVIGNDWYAFNYVTDSSESGTQNKLLCFNLSSFGPCASQPFSLGIGSATVSDSAYPPPAVSGIASNVIVPITLNSNDVLECFNGVSETMCSGSWPIKLGFSYDSDYGAAFPLMTASAQITGLCLPSPGDPCYGLSGNVVSSPSGLSAAISPTSGWNGPAFLLGPRAYVPDGINNSVECYDFDLGVSCANFPKPLSNLDLLYTVNPDPARPTCIWVNSDNGQDQIQNFDAYTGAACGQGAIRVLASNLVAPGSECVPTHYTTLQVLSPPPNAYTSGSVSFEDADGNPIPGIPAQTLVSGSIDLSSLNLNTTIGLPEF